MEKLSQLNSRIPEKLVDSFNKSIPRGTNKQHVMSAAVRLWVSLPRELKNKLIQAESDLEENPKAAKDSFVEVVRLIAEKVYQDKMSRPRKKKSEKS